MGEKHEPALLRAGKKLLINPRTATGADWCTFFEHLKGRPVTADEADRFAQFADSFRAKLASKQARRHRRPGYRGQGRRR